LRAKSREHGNLANYACRGVRSLYRLRLDDDALENAALIPFVGMAAMRGYKSNSVETGLE
jgi:hypothetical protein